MTKVGIEPVPPGETADFDDFSNLQVGILTVYVVTFVLATAGLALRFYTGACIVRNLGIDACTFVSFLLQPSVDVRSQEWLQTTQQDQDMSMETLGRNFHGMRRHCPSSPIVSSLPKANPAYRSSPPCIMGNLSSMFCWHDQGLPLRVR